MRTLFLLAVVLMMVGGQLLFKQAATQIGSISWSWATLGKLVLNPYLITGGVLYALTTLLWVAVLTKSDLSRSYPFVALTLVLVPLAGAVLFNEPITISLIVGGLLIVLGVTVIAVF